MSAITTHILDTSRGRPGVGVAITLAKATPAGSWQEIASGVTDSDGRVSDLLPPGEAPQAGVYRLRFEIGAYFQEFDQPTFYPYAEVVFEIKNLAEHYHVPLLVNPFGYSTYRGS